MARRFLNYILIFLLFGQINYLLAQNAITYSDLIKSADAYLAKKDYYNAKTTYQLALQLDKNAEYPKKKIEEIIQKLNDELELRILFEDKILLAEEAYAAKEFQKAIELYRQASAIIDYEEKPKQEIARIEKEWKDLLARQNEFAGLIEEASVDKKSQNYNSALEKLEKANLLFPSKLEVLTEIAQLKLLIKQQNTKQTKFKSLVDEGDKRLKVNSFKSALESYQDAAQLFENDEYVRNQILLVKKAIEIENAYNKLIEEADNHYIALKFEDAEIAYEAARKLWPEKSYPDNMLTKLNEARQRQDKDFAALNKEYNSKIILADKQFNSKAYEQASDLYIKALNIKPNEEYPQNQIQKINRLLASGLVEVNCEILENGNTLSNVIIQMTENGTATEIPVQNDGKYNLKLKLNSKYILDFKKQNYIHKIYTIDTYISDKEDIKLIYSINLKVDLFPGCALDLSLFEAPIAEIEYKSDIGEFSYDLARVQEILSKADQLKLACNQLIAENKKVQEYEKLLAEADSFQQLEDYQAAIISYQKAAKIFPDKDFAKNQIIAIQAILKVNEEYNQLIAEGDSKYAKGQLNDALFDYYKAKNLRPNEPYPPKIIAEIDKILGLQGLAEKNYQDFVRKADSLFDLKVWEGAITQYAKAIELKKYEIYPQNKMEQAKTFLAAKNKLDASYQAAINKGDSYFDRLLFAEAKIAFMEANRIKPDEEYPLYKIEDINTIVEQKDIKKTNDRYRELILLADKNLEEKIYQLSLNQYKQAAGFKPNETYPPIQIAKIDQILSRQKELDAKYAQFIKSADSAYNLENWNESRAIYVQATELKPKEEYPVNQINKIDALLANLNDLETNYKSAIERADASFVETQYINAKTDYKLALTFKPKEIYPPAQIAKIDQILSLQKELDAKYAQFIKSADSAYNLENWNESRAIYVQATELKPKEEYPVNQINKIDALLANLNDLETNYKSAIVRADASFVETQYINAKTDYKLALTFKPKEIYPKQKIEEIDNLIAQMNAIEAAYQKEILAGDQNFKSELYTDALSNYKAALKIKENEVYPKTKILEIETLLEKLAQLYKSYNQAIAKADELFKNKNYTEALPYYKEANTIKPDEKYPPEQIVRINNFLAASYEQYNKFIKQGDYAFKLVIFQDAIFAYESALGIFPKEEYPRMMLDKIDEIIRREAVLNLVPLPETIEAGVEKRYTFNPIAYRDRQDNYILIEMKNASAAPIRVFINFGKDGQKNGGYSINLVQREGYSKYFVRIDRQLRWLNEDNNWISLLPQGGDLEVNRIQISRKEKSN